MNYLLAKTKEVILDVLFPPLCLACGNLLEGAEKTEFVCGTCIAAIPLNTSLTCPECGGRLAENVKVCHRDTRYRLAAASRYDDPRVRKLIWELKYGKKVGAAKPIVSMMKRHLEAVRLNLNGYGIIPMPLHPFRLRERGFNQADLIAEGIREWEGMTVAKDILKRVRATPPQAEAKNFEERMKNISGSFSVPREELVRGKNFIILDDVFTSGATVGEAVKTLRAAGARRILALIAAKA